MPRKVKHQDAFRKTPAGYVHPAMEATADSSPSSPSESSVNARIEYLRGVQGRPQMSISSDELLRSTHAPARSKKRMAGPPPPRSWLEHNRSKSCMRSTAGRPPPNLDHLLPVIKIPDKTSLVHLSLKSLAADWDEQVEFSGDWLSTLPRHLKTLLLTYVARYGPDDGISIKGLRLLMSSEVDTGSSDSTGCHDISRLDLAGAYGRRITAKQLKAYLLSAGGKKREKPRWKVKDAPPDSWDESSPLDTTLEKLTLRSGAFYEHLTHLSLEDPGPVSWAEFVDIVSPHLGRVTHLSLARWPSPKPDNVLSDSSQGVIIGESDMEMIGRYRLQCLSRNTSQLQYLCLGGCHTWFDLFRQPLPSSHSTRNPPRITAAFGESETISNAKREKPDSSDQMFVMTWRRLATLDLIDTSLPVPGPEHLDSLTLTDTLCKREPYRAVKRTQIQDLPLVRVPLAEGGYREIVADWRISSYMSLHSHTRQWVLAEHEKMKLVRYIRQVRGAGHGLTALYGGEREALLAAGWSEAELFSHGL